MNRSTPGLPVHHQLPEFTEAHIQDHKAGKLGADMWMDAGTLL